MRRLFVFLLRIAVLVAAAVWLAERPGTARIEWHDYVIECSAAFLGLATLALAFIIYLLLRVWHIFRHGPELWRLGRKVKKLEQGQDYLTQGLVAVAGGHAAEAGRLAIAARKKLGETAATLLLQAQAAQLAHDHRSARAIYRAMVEDEASATLGYRGLIMDARRNGDWHEVERLLVEVGRLKSSMPWLDHIRFETATRRQAWVEAAEALARLAPTKLLEPTMLRRNHGALLIALSQDEARQGNAEAALEFAERAARQAPDWLPVQINLAQRQAASSHARAARRTVEKAWGSAPHQQLAEILRAAAKDPIEGYKQIERLAHAAEDNPVVHRVMAEAALAADIWGEARRHLMQLVARDQATQSTYRLLARLERREGNDERAASQWLAKAAEAAPDATWLCSACGASHEDFVPVCRSCASFATLEWRTPGSAQDGSKPLPPLLTDWAVS